MGYVTLSGRITKSKAPAMRLGQQMVYIYVDNGPLPVQVHKNVILRSSEFFKKALTSNFKETSGVITLRDQRRELVETYVEWLYFSVINPIEPESKDVLDRFKQLYDLFVMADMFQDQDFANAVMDVLLKETDTVERWPTAFAAGAWVDLPRDSMVRKYVKDLWISRSCSEWYEQGFGDLTDAPKQFWIEVAKMHTLIREKKEKALKPCFANRCRYHVHQDGTHCT